MSDNKTIAHDSLERILDSDPSLTRKVTYEEATATISGINDEEIEIAYNAYKDLEKSGVKSKGLSELIEEDPSLTRKVTYEEATATTSEINDLGIKKSYSQYQKFKSRMKS